MFTDTRGDGICRSKSNAAALGTDVVVALDVVVTGSVEVVVGVGVVVVVMLSGGSVAAMVTCTTVVGGGVMTPSTTLRRLTVATGTSAA
jgi:hypothetical protein